MIMEAIEILPATFPILESERLKLVGIQQEHLMDIFKLFGDSQVTEFYNIKTFDKVEDGQVYLDWFRNRFKDKLGIRWGIQLKGETGIIGTIGFNNFTYNHRANIGYDLQSEYWNRGYMTEALKRVVEFGFDVLRVNRIEAEVMAGNTASEKILAKTGFRKEGLLRDWMYWDQRHFDMIMYAYLRTDFTQR